MKSRTKNLLSEEQIKKLVRVNFGESCTTGKITQLKGGMFNSAYLIERISEQDKIVLKVSLKPDTKTLSYESDPMPTEVAVFKKIAEETTIPTPKILSFDFSKKEIQSNYLFMTALEGITMHKVQKEISPENMLEIKKELADYMGQLHKIRGEYFGYFTENEKEQYKTWKEAFLHMFDVLLSDGKKNGTKLPYERYEKILQEKATYLENIKEASLIDYDLWAGNVVVTQQEQKFIIEGLIDFERAFWGDPMADFAGSVMLLDNIFEEKEVWEKYQESVGIAHAITKEVLIRNQLYRLYIYTIMAAEIFRYGFVYGKLQSSYAMKHIEQCFRMLEEL